jgi:Alpha/beta hydrolase family
METRSFTVGAPGAHGIRIVLLPGAYHALEEFSAAGFDAALRERALALELILAAPHLAHLNDRDWLGQLRAEVIEPARGRGDGALWLGGISLGGFMALRFAAESTQALDGLCLLAPYLGSRIIAAEVGAHGNLANWTPPAVLADDDDERRIWRLVQQLPRMNPAPRLFLGYGREDRFADTQRLLARSLPPAASHEVAGGHDWSVWRTLWDEFLDTLALDTPA